MNGSFQIDPNNSASYAGLADCYVLLSAYSASTPEGSFPPAKAAAEKALELDDSLGQAHASLGQLLMFYDYDFPGSAREFKRAIELSPNYATAHAAWKAKAQQTVDNAHMRYFVVHLHRLLDPSDDTKHSH